MTNTRKKVKIGIAFEGRRDIKPLEIIIEKILTPQFDPIIIKKRTPHTGLIGFIKPYIKFFFEIGESVDIAVFITDQDQQKKNVKQTVLKTIEAYNATYKMFSVVGVPFPHFEDWLLADQGLVKQYFSLDATKALPNIDNSPKLTLEYLQRHMKEPQKPLFQVYEELASEIHLGTSRTLKTFANELFSAARYL